MIIFVSLTPDEQVQYAHALEQKVKRLIDALRRRQRLAAELDGLIPAEEQNAVLEKISEGYSARLNAIADEEVTPDAIREARVSGVDAGFSGFE